MSYNPIPHSPFAQVGQLLYDRGFSPIPITPGDKKPGIMIGDEWRLFKGWNEHCITRPSAFQVKQWSKYPNAGIGVACGMGLICIDIDQENLIAPLLAILPPSLVQKKGRKGISLFYRGNTEVIRSKNYRTPERVGLVDLLAEGKQTVLPPSIHPDTGEPYYWWSDLGLQDVTLDELEPLPENVGDQIAEVLKGFGYDPDHERREVPLSSSGRRSESENIWRQANNDALANLHAWVPKLHLYKWRHKPGGFEAVAHWRASGTGRAIERRKRNLSIVGKGIEDFGSGYKYTPIDLIMKARGCDKSVALNWLLEQLPQNEPLILLRK